MIKLDTPYITPQEDVLKISRDECPFSPRDDYHITNIVTVESRYKSPDENPFDSMEELIDTVCKEESEYIWDYVSRHEHGIVIYSRGKSSGWDSCTCGIIFISKEAVCELYQVKEISQEVLIRVFDMFDSELEEYTNYVNGDVYGYKLYQLDGELIDDCWGFYEGPEGCLDYLGFKESDLEEAEEITARTFKKKEKTL